MITVTTVTTVASVAGVKGVSLDCWQISGLEGDDSFSQIANGVDSCIWGDVGLVGFVPAAGEGSYSGIRQPFLTSEVGPTPHVCRSRT